MINIGTAALAIAMTVGAVNAHAVQDDAAVIAQQSREFSDASASGDAKVIEKYLDDDVVFMDESGSVGTKQEIVASAKPSPNGIHNALVQSDWNLKLLGNVAVTSFTDNSTMTVYGQTYYARYRSTEVWLKKNGAWRMISSQTLAVPDDPAAIRLPADQLDQYAGTYEATSSLVVRIERKDDTLISSTNGATGTPLRVEVRDVLFTPGQPRMRRIFERDANGRVTGFVTRREGHDLHFKRMT